MIFVFAISKSPLIVIDTKPIYNVKTNDNFISPRCPFSPQLNKNPSTTDKNPLTILVKFQSIGDKELHCSGLFIPSLGIEISNLGIQYPQPGTNSASPQ